MSKPIFSEAPKLFHDLNSDDDIGLLIRAHLHVERAVRGYIDQCVPFPERLPRLTYDSAVRLACALGLDETYLAPLKALGKLRNHFGHSQDAVLGEKEVSELLASFTENGRDRIAASYESVRQRGAITGPESFADLPPGNKFGLVVVLLRTALAQALGETGSD
jgi:hypothetical protein